MSPTAGVRLGKFTTNDRGRLPPGAVGGRSSPIPVPVIWFQGHIVSRRLWPILTAPGPPARPKNGYVSILVRLKRRLSHCHFAHKRSTLVCSIKNKGSRAALPISLIKP